MDITKKHIITDLIEYLPQAIVTKTILNKGTCNITASSLDAGMKIGCQTSSFDKYIQIIDGAAELTIDQTQFTLNNGQGIIIPSNSCYSLNANEPFKMISTIIMCGNEE